MTAPELRVLWVHLPTVVVQVGFGAAPELRVLWVQLPTVVVQVGFVASTTVARHIPENTLVGM